MADGPRERQAATAADVAPFVRATNPQAATEYITAQAIHQYRARGGRPGKAGSAVQWSTITASVIEALRMAPVEERMALMGMRLASTAEAEVEPFVWVEVERG